MKTKSFKHFQNPQTVFDLCQEIRQRHSKGYSALLESMIGQMRSYFQNQFPNADRKAGRSRFEQTDSELIKPRFLVALSGGIDSSLVTALAVKAVGTDYVLPITMPARSGDPCVQMAEIVRNYLGFPDVKLPYLIDIQEIIKTHVQTMDSLNIEQIELSSKNTQNKEQKMRSGNFASRVRAAVLYDFTRSVRGRVLGTVNRSEFCQGYNSKYGTPISYDFGVLNSLYKIDIYELAKMLEMPKIILESEPTTGYFEGQTHEGELGASIEEQDIFAYLLFEKNMAVEQIVEKYYANEEFANLMLYRYRVCQHKRVLNQNQEQIDIFL